MSVSTMAAGDRVSAPVPTRPGLGARVRRALIAAGWPAVVFGVVLGLLQARPDLIWAKLPLEAPDAALALVGMALIGLFSGVVAGRWLRGATSLLRLATAMFAVVAAMVAGKATQGLVEGLPLGESLRIGNDLAEAFQLGLALLGTLVGIRTGRTPTAPARNPAVSPSQPARGQTSRSRPRPARSSAPTRQVDGSTARPEVGRRGPAHLPQPQFRTQRGDAARRRHSSGGLRLPGLAPAPKRAKARRGLRRSVHLGRQVSSVCPYCLEEVKPNDPRGRVVCKICGTPHHADCWAITGKCEVPHLQT